MDGHLTPDQALAKDVEKLGTIYGTAFHHCCQELWRVSANWDRYEALFGSRERVDILNSSSGNFWYVIQGILHEYVLLGICRLTDPPGSGLRSNLAVTRLPLLDPTSSKEELSERVHVAVDAARFARTWRDKRIGHNDFVQLTEQADLLEPSTGLKISSAIVSIHNVLRWIQGRYFDGDMALHDLGDSDVYPVLTALAVARAAKDEEKALFKERRLDELMAKMSHYPKASYGREKRYADQGKLAQPAPYSGPYPLQSRRVI